MMGLPDGPKSFRIGLVVLIQYRLWRTATQPASQPPSKPRRRSYYAQR